MNFIEELRRAKGSALTVQDSQIATRFSMILVDALSDIGLRPDDWKIVLVDPKRARGDEVHVDRKIVISREGGYIKATVAIPVDDDDLVVDVDGAISADAVTGVNVDGHIVWPPHALAHADVREHLLHKVSFLRSHKGA